MRLFGRRKNGDGEGPRQNTLADDAAAMRSTLDRMQAQERLARGTPGSVDLRAIVSDLLEGEVAPPTGDIEELQRRKIDPRDFYEREIAPGWENLGEDERAARIEGFLELALTVDAGEAGALPEEMVAMLRTKALLLAWAFDETYSYMSWLAAGAR